MESLKIAFFCWESLYAERVGGLANAATNLAETLARHHEVHYFTRGEGRDTEINGVRYHYCRPAGENLVQYCSDMSGRMIDRFREFDAPSFDLLHFHDWHVVDALRRLRERETIFTYHSTEFGRNGNAFSSGWPFPEISGIERYGGLIAKRITAVSSTLRREAMKLYDIPDWKIDVVPNGIVPDHYQADVEPEEVKRRYGFDPDSPLILFVGRLAWQKGPDMLVDAAPGLSGALRRSVRLRWRRADAAGASRPGPVAPVRFLEDWTMPTTSRSSTRAISFCPGRNEPFRLVLLEAWARAMRCVRRRRALREHRAWDRWGRAAAP